MSKEQHHVARPRDVAEDLLARYCGLLDEGRLEEWADLFPEGGSYRILSRENVAQGLPGAILLLETRAAMLDRIAALRETAVYNIHYSRRFYSAVQASARDDGTVEFTANVCVYQSDQDGHSRLFCVGQYQGTMAAAGTAPIAQMTVLIDTFAIPTLLAVPV
jgi:anthranilate 1,2-dioxygenase small subunit